jgi:hypothetical protein
MGALKGTIHAAASEGLKVSVHLRTGSANPAQQVTEYASTLAALERLAKTRHIRIFLDTLVAQDRGYFPRPGALDPLGNPTAIAMKVSEIHSRNTGR